MKKLIVVLVIIAGLYQWFKPPSMMEQLMQSSATDQGGIRQVSWENKSSFDLYELAVPDTTTIVEFYTDACSGCRRLHQHFKKFLPLRPDVAVRQVKMPDNWQPAWAQRQFHLAIASTPHIIIFDVQGKVVAQDDSNDKVGFKKLYDWMNAELRKR